MKTYEYNNSQALFERAVKVIPAGIYGHLGPSEGCFIPVSAYPFYAKRAKGAYVWDVDDNRFIDYMCAYGPNILGYGHEAVDEAAAKQFREGNCTIIPTEKMVTLAELMVDTVASADWAFFAKNGGDVTNLAVMTARAATGREKIVKFIGGYHGVAQWMQSLGYPGIIKSDVENVLAIPFNDVAAFEQVVAEQRGKIACLIATPYHHPAMADNQVPLPDFWQKIRKICTDNGIILIIDDVRCGFRLDVQGSDHYYGFEADLICFCKALANGYNISALCGKNFLKSAASSVFYTGSYWLSAAPMAAAIETVSILKKINAPQMLLENGRILTEGLVQKAQKHEFNLLVTGEPSMWYMRITDDESNVLHQRWISECVRRGAFFASHHNLFMNCAMTQEDIDLTLEIADEAFGVVAKERA